MDSTFGGSQHSAPQPAPSQYLQERLQERRARSQRPSRSRQSDFGPRRGQDDDIFLTLAEENAQNSRIYEHSPYRAASSRRSIDVGESSVRKRAMGARDMDEQLDRLNKQNFALKLELDHRRDDTVKLRQTVEDMRDKVERADRMEEEHAELLKINSKLVEELEKRDRAVEEAMDIICDLEEKVNDMEERSSTTRPSTANADSGYAGTETHDQGSTPESRKLAARSQSTQRAPPVAASAASSKLFSAVNRPKSLKHRREPSILNQKKESTHALRSVYLESAKDLNSVKSFTSLLSRRDANGEDALNSPRLSVLSESSFPSIYSPQKENTEEFGWQSPNVDDTLRTGRPHYRQDSMTRVSRWIDEGEVVDDTPSKTSRPSVAASDSTARGLSPTPKPRQAEDGPYMSLNDALSSVSLAAGHAENDLPPEASYVKPYRIRHDGQKLPKSQLTSIGGPIFGEPLLPPTPDSATTAMLRNSYGSIVDEKSQEDVAPRDVRTYGIATGTAMSPKQMRSSIELNSAYLANQKYREDLYEPHAQDDPRADGYGETRRIYDGYPDGGSIVMGTPSRLLKHAKSPVASKIFDESNMPTPTTVRQVPTRRVSNSEAYVSPQKPAIGRAETSPTFLGAFGRMVSAGSRHASGDNGQSPKSTNSGSGVSSTRTLVQPDEPQATMSPENFVRRSRTSASPARTLSQKTQQLFRRRMSNSQTERFPEPRSPREKSPLPTLTSTPSSAYLNQPPKEHRRPNTAESPRAQPTSYMSHIPAQGTPTTGSRPSLGGRSQPGSHVRSSSVAASSERANSALEKESRNPFRRSNSVQKPVIVEQQRDVVMSIEPVEERPSRRRGSIREAVAATARRPFGR